MSTRIIRSLKCSSIRNGKSLRCSIKYARFDSRAQTQYTEETKEVSSPKDTW